MATIMDGIMHIFHLPVKEDDRFSELDLSLYLPPGTRLSADNLKALAKIVGNRSKTIAYVIAGIVGGKLGIHPCVENTFAAQRELMKLCKKLHTTASPEGSIKDFPLPEFSEIYKGYWQNYFENMSAAAASASESQIDASTLSPTWNNLSKTSPAQGEETRWFRVSWEKLTNFPKGFFAGKSAVTKALSEQAVSNNVLSINLTFLTTRNRYQGMYSLSEIVTTFTDSDVNNLFDGIHSFLESSRDTITTIIIRAEKNIYPIQFTLAAAQVFSQRCIAASSNANRSWFQALSGERTSVVQIQIPENQLIEVIPSSSFDQASSVPTLPAGFIYAPQKTPAELEAMVMTFNTMLAAMEDYLETLLPENKEAALTSKLAEIEAFLERVAPELRELYQGCWEDYRQSLSSSSLQTSSQPQAETGSIIEAADTTNAAPGSPEPGPVQLIGPESAEPAARETEVNVPAETGDAKSGNGSFGMMRFHKPAPTSHLPVTDPKPAQWYRPII